MSRDNCPPHLIIAGFVSCLYLCVGLFFWGWSVLLIAGGTADSGVVLFLFPISTGVVGLWIVYLCWQHTNRGGTDSHGEEKRGDEEEDAAIPDPHVGSSSSRCGGCCCCVKQSIKRCWFILFFMTHIFCTVVYAVASQISDLSPEYQLYCKIAAVCWAIGGFLIIFMLASCFRNKFDVGIAQSTS